jgi:mannosyltransferase OCH1-like enzyme
MIPKTIHYCWFSNDAFPDEFKKYMGTWMEKLIGYDMILWDSKRFNINEHLWVKQAIEAKKYAFAADYIKFYSLYNYGGIYLDSDVEVIKSFDDLLDTDILLAYENDKTKKIEGGILGAKKHSAFIKRCLDYYHNRQFIESDGSYDMRVLPQIMREILAENNYHINVYPSEYFTANNWETGIIKITSKTYSIHHFAGSWLSNDQKKHINFGRFISRIFGKSIFAKVLLFFFHMFHMFHSIFLKIIWFRNRTLKIGCKNAFKYYFKKYLRVRGSNRKCS